MPNVKVKLEDFDEKVRPMVEPLFEVIENAEKEITKLGQSNGELKKENQKWGEFDRTFLQPNFEFRDGKIRIRPEGLSAIENADEIMRSANPGGGEPGDDYLTTHEKDILGLVEKNFDAVVLPKLEGKFITSQQGNDFAQQVLATMGIGFKIRDFQKDVPELVPAEFLKFAQERDLAGNEKQIDSAFEIYKEQKKRDREAKENAASGRTSADVHAAAGKVSGSPDGSSAGAQHGDVVVERDPVKRRAIASEMAHKIFEKGE